MQEEPTTTDQPWEATIYEYSYEELELLQNCMVEEMGSISRGLKHFLLKRPKATGAVEIMELWLPFAEEVSKGKLITDQFPKKEFTQSPQPDHAPSPR